MDLKVAIADSETKFKNAVTHFEGEAKKVRTGRAQPSMLDGIMVEAYGSSMPLIQAASISAPESQLLQITPFDPGNLQSIVKAIRDNPSLGLNPMDDGRMVRVPIPPLTEERRREYVKILGDKVEDCMIALRSIRHSALDAINQAKKDKMVGEDDARRYEKQVDEAMSKAKAAVEAVSRAKETEIMKV